MYSHSVQNDNKRGKPKLYVGVHWYCMLTLISLNQKNFM